MSELRSPLGRESNSLQGAPLRPARLGGFWAALSLGASATRRPAAQTPALTTRPPLPTPAPPHPPRSRRRPARFSLPALTGFGGGGRSARGGARRRFRVNFRQLGAEARACAARRRFGIAPPADPGLDRGQAQCRRAALTESAEEVLAHPVPFHPTGAGAAVAEAAGLPHRRQSQSRPSSRCRSLTPTAKPSPATASDPAHAAHAAASGGQGRHRRGHGREARASPGPAPRAPGRARVQRGFEGAERPRGGAGRRGALSGFGAFRAPGLGL